MALDGTGLVQRQIDPAELPADAEILPLPELIPSCGRVGGFLSTQSTVPVRLAHDENSMPFFNRNGQNLAHDEKKLK